MMDSSKNSLFEYAASLAAPYRPLVPIEKLVLGLNRLYHRYEADDYDHSHDEIRVQLPEIWRQMLGQALRIHGDRKLRVLDFGCGTGFEAQQLLNVVPADRIGQLVCYDLSAEMLERCRQRLAGSNVEVVFTDCLEDLQSINEPFDILMTNSLLHHLPDPLGTVAGYLPHLAADAVWLSGHEPSSRFYKNPACQEHLAQFAAGYSWKKYLSPRKHWARIRRLLAHSRDPAMLTAIASVQEGLFERRPTSQVVSRLVDFHVAHSLEEATVGRGFDFEEIIRSLAGTWTLRWVRTYSFMGSFYEGALPRKWRTRCHDLRSQFPHDGANVCCVWQRGEEETRLAALGKAA